MRKYTVLILLMLTAVVTITRFGGGVVPQPPQTDSKPEQIKAVHYFSSSWPKSFWEDFEQSQVDDDFAQIKADGFNTIILVIPWMGFETGFEDGVPEPSQLYDRLEWLLTKIDQAGLAYGLRVSFPHSFDPENGIGTGKLCTDIFVSSAHRENWLQYLSRIAQRVDQHRDSFKFAFFSWEDFFCPYASIPNLNEDQRLDLARRSGYQSWLAEHYPMQLLELLYLRSFNSMESVPVPDRKSPAFWLFLRFIDQFLVDQLITPGRQVLPELAMEVRVDKDPIHNGDKISWAEHDLMLSDDRLRGSYWGAYYGANNQGELLSANEALKHFEHMLDEVSDHGKNINHIVEQFNFADNTPGYVGRHAQIKNNELPAFLEGAAELLKQKSRGYGLWTYRDYMDSAIYNSSFELGLRGWDTQGQVTVITNVDGDQALRMQAAAVISQTFAPFNRFAGLGSSEQLTFCANFKRLAEPARITLSVNGKQMSAFDISETGQHCVEMDAQPIKQASVVFSVSSDAETQLDDLRLFSYVQKLNVYDEYGQPGPLRDLIVRLNTDWLAN
jgi:hypothetical protein